MIQTFRKAIRKYRSDGMHSLLFTGYEYLFDFSVRMVHPATLCTRKFERSYGRGIDIMTEDWDNLILFDACRYDEFARENPFAGKLKRTVSQGRDSAEFLSQNVFGRELHDTVYVTANPHVHNIDSDVFHAVIDEPIRDNFDDDIGTVLPEHVTDAAIRAHRKFPNKRLLVHYMQPHMPPIGEMIEQLDKLQSGFDMRGTQGDRDRFYNLVERGVVSPEEAKTAYRQNLRKVFQEIPSLSEIEGKTVISADHGELLGESPCLFMGPSWSHGLTRSYFPKTEALCLVPWFELDRQTPRRTITKEKPVETNRIDEAHAKEQLEALGYL